MTSLIYFSDKTYPINHSYVNGMVAEEWGKVWPGRVYITCAATSARRAKKMSCAVCLPSAPPRRGRGRLTGVCYAVKVLYFLSKKKNDSNIVAVVRNDPALLAGAVIARILGKCGSVYFHSSFPHENYGSGIKQKIARLILRGVGRYISGGLVVSDLGATRLRKSLRRHTLPVHVSPLGVGRDFLNKAQNCSIQEHRKAKVIYLGSIKKDRGLEPLFWAVRDVVDEGADVKLDVFTSDVVDKRNGSSKTVAALSDDNAVVIRPPVPLTNVPDLLASYAIGVCIVPPEPQFLESTPTKIGEYLAAGLIVIANTELPYHRKMVSQTRAVVPCELNREDVARALKEGMRRISLGASSRQLRFEARRFAEKKLSYPSMARDAVRFLLENRL